MGTDLRRKRDVNQMSAEQKVALAEAALEAKRAINPVILDMRELTIVTDYFLICHGTSNVHIRGLADAVQEAFEKQEMRAMGAEGYTDGRWILLDYGDLVIHIFAEEERSYYDLERLWSDAPRVAPLVQG